MNTGNKSTFLEQTKEITQTLVNKFHALYYYSSGEGKTWKNTFWMGLPCQKCPLDMWIYQEIIFKNKPDLIIETGSGSGGSSLYLAMMCDLIGHGNVVSIDINWNVNWPKHPRLKYLHGSSTSSKITNRLKASYVGIEENKTCMVILDSDHHKKHVDEELKLYSEFVSYGQYLVVEDGNVNGHPVCEDHGGGPFEAVADFLLENNNFKIDKELEEKFLLTFNPNGYLRRVL